MKGLTNKVRPFFGAPGRAQIEDLNQEDHLCQVNRQATCFQHTKVK